MAAQQVVPLNEGWRRIHDEGVLVLEEFLQTGQIRESVTQTAGKPKRIFSNADYTELYTLVYNMCTQRSPNNWQSQLYAKYGETMQAYISKKVLVGLEKRSGVDLLRSLKTAWSNHQIYVKWMTRFFTYLDRYYVKLQAVPSLSAKGYGIFQTHVFQAISGETREALLAAIRSERDGEANFDGDLVKTVCSIFIELGLYVSTGHELQHSVLATAATSATQGAFSHPQHGLQIYISEFEAYFLPDSKDYYARQAAGWLETNSFSEYLQQADQAIKKESERVKAYLHRTTEHKLKMVLLDAFLNEDTRKILLDKPTAMSWLLENDKRDDLSRAHKLFSLIDNGLSPLAQTFKQHVTAKGNAIVEERLKQLDSEASSSTKKANANDGLNDPTFIQKLLDLHDHYKAVVTNSFSSDSLFQKALKEAFEAFVNRDMGKHSAAALMSHFCNRLLKKGGTPGERLNDRQVDDTLKKVVDLFNYLSEKDLFAEIYRNQLAKRLLEDASASDEAEKSLISMLKMKCGAQFTSKMEGMCNDLKLATDENSKFDEWCAEKGKKATALTMGGGVVGTGGSSSSSSGAAGASSTQEKISIEFGVTVLATGYWPAYTPTEIKLPRQLSTCLDVFTEYYDQKTQHRKLTWIHSQGTAVVAAKFDRKHDLVCSTLQAVVLLLFSGGSAAGGPSGGEGAATGTGGAGSSSGGGGAGAGGKDREHTCASLQREISANAADPIEVSQIKRIIGTLACSKHRVLAIKRQDEIVEQPKTVSEQDTFLVHAKFTCPHRKVKLPSVSSSSSGGNSEETHKQERVEEDRSHAVEAAIVRIMKARRRLTHQQLSAEVLQQLHFFKPSVKMIKQKIEHLIERDYLERDSDDANTYKYLA